MLFKESYVHGLSVTFIHTGPKLASITVTRAQKSISAGSDGGGSSGSSAGGGGSSYSPGGGGGGCERDGRQTTSQQVRTRARARTHTELASEREREREIGDAKKMDIDKMRLGKLANTKRKKKTINGRPQLTT